MFHLRNLKNAIRMLPPHQQKKWKRMFNEHLTGGATHSPAPKESIGFEILRDGENIKSASLGLESLSSKR